MTDSQILIAGLARSGTTWLAKLLDSHPATLYRHEPDRPPLFPSMPYLLAPSHTDYYQSSLQQFGSGLRAQNRVQVAGTLPVFRKDSEKLLNYQARRMLTSASRLASQWLGNIRLFDLFRPHGEDMSRVVWKSVWSVGRLGAILHAMPQLRVVFLIRHPCGVIFSRHRGVTNGEMAPLSHSEFAELKNYNSPSTQRLLAQVDQNDVLEMEAFRWALLNSKAIEELHACQDYLVIRYEDLCADPTKVMSQILGCVDLPWDGQIDRFILDSAARTSSRFYGLHRKTENIDPWRDSMPLAKQQRVLDIVNGSTAGNYYT